MKTQKCAVLVTATLALASMTHAQNYFAAPPGSGVSGTNSAVVPAPPASTLAPGVQAVTVTTATPTNIWLRGYNAGQEIQVTAANTNLGPDFILSASSTSAVAAATWLLHWSKTNNSYRLYNVSNVWLGTNRAAATNGGYSVATVYTNVFTGGAFTVPGAPGDRLWTVDGTADLQLPLFLSGVAGATVLNNATNEFNGAVNWTLTGSPLWVGQAGKPLVVRIEGPAGTAGIGAHQGLTNRVQAVRGLYMAP